MRNYLIVTFLVSVLYCPTVLSADSPDSNVNVVAKASYYDAIIIAENIKRECTELGGNFSRFTKTYLEELGYATELKPTVDRSAAGRNLILTIINAVSAGNVFVGHRKSVSIRAELFVDGQLMGKYEGTRNSRGGFGGGFSGSCDILDRCVSTLGKDVAKWVKKQDLINRVANTGSPTDKTPARSGTNASVSDAEPKE